MATISIKQLTKVLSFKEKKFKVLDNINLEIKEGEFVTVLGPNGCGKTTLLNIISGIEKPTKGVTKIKPPARIGFVFQNYEESLFPWRTVKGNIGFALEAGNKKNKEEKADAALRKINSKEINLLQFKNNFVYELSGGMKQLTAIARALAFEPEIFLMDEPFSSLDYTVTRKMEELVLRIWRKTKKTTVFVSHDVDEAIYLADRIIVFTKRPAKVKKVIQVDLPRPRKNNMRMNKRFFQLRNAVLKAFEGE